MSKFDKFKIVKEWQLKNIFSILVTFDVIKCSNLIIFKLVHPSNIDFILMADEVSKSNKLILIKDKHPLNI